MWEKMTAGPVRTGIGAPSEKALRKSLAPPRGRTVARAVRGIGRPAGTAGVCHATERWRKGREAARPLVDRDAGLAADAGPAEAGQGRSDRIDSARNSVITGRPRRDPAVTGLLGAVFGPTSS